METKRILLFESSPDLITVLEEFLARTNGHDVVVARSIEDALKTLPHEDYDLAIVDVDVFPPEFYEVNEKKFHGKMFAAEILRNSRDAKLIFLSNIKGDVPDEWPYLEKPFTLEKLAEMMEK